MNPLPWFIGAGAVIAALCFFRLRGFQMGRRRQRIEAAKAVVVQAKRVRAKTTERLEQAGKELDDAKQKEQDDLADIDSSARNDNPLRRIRDSMGRFRNKPDG